MRDGDTETEPSTWHISSDERGLQGTQLYLASVSFLCDRIIML